MVIVGMVDDIPVEYYDSIDRKMISRRHWHKEAEVPDQQMKRLILAHTAYNVKNKFEHIQEHFNHSGQRPRIRVLQKQVEGAGQVKVTCLATGFYPRHIELTLHRGNQPIPEQELTGGEILPNGDRTYQLRLSLSVSAEELREGHRYTCSVRHVSMDNKLDVTWESLPGPDVALISGALVTVLSTVLLNSRWHLHLDEEEEQCARMQQDWEERGRDGKDQCCWRGDE
ncbi:hypothetical protein SKAU_G00033330 [Synaphobranchus kaupii]|uniref:Ig-like domain-containing protein n=1 Tax=Synaphobranchus kaupii TaxID=118154 RepID=A0A9Q1GFG7_SYNKA|nr:hypothetical protein SKAU_G00033330 [Synaphobranchus kaupii]